MKNFDEILRNEIENNQLEKFIKNDEINDIKIIFLCEDCDIKSTLLIHFIKISEPYNIQYINKIYGINLDYFFNIKQTY